MEENYKDIVKATVTTALIQALDKDSEQLIIKLVNEVLSKKESYGNKTFLEDTVHGFIKNIARQIVEESVLSKKELIVAAVNSRLTEKFYQNIMDRMDVDVRF